MSKKPSFSCVLIVRNEEKTLPRLLNSLKEFFARGGECIILDTGSVDSTADIARKYGCKVEEVGDMFRRTIDEDLAEKINKKFIVKREKPVVQEGDSLFDFSAARNYAASLASNDICAMPDADEIYTKFDIDKIEEAIKAGAEQLEYSFVFSRDQFGNPGIQFMHCKFYDRTKLSWTGVTHEVLCGSAKRQYLDESIIKLEHCQNTSTDRSGYIKGLALDCFLHQDNDRNSHYLARELMWSGRPMSAIREFGRHIAMDKWPAERAQSMIFVGDCFMQVHKEKRAVYWWKKAFDLDPTRRESLLRLADFYFKKEEWQKVVCYVGAALEIGYSPFYANNASDYAQRPHELMYLSKWRLGAIDEARRHFDRALAYQPLNSKYLFDYRFFYQLPKVSIVIPQLGREEGLKRCLESIERLNYPKELLETLVYDGEGTVPEKIHRGYKESTGEFIFFLANDTECTPDCLILAILAGRMHKKALVAFNTGELSADKGNECEHFIIRKDFVEEIGGEIFDLKIGHTGCDNLLKAKAEKLDQFMRCEEAVVHHYHFSKGTAEFDEISAIGWEPERREKDAAILQEELAKL